MRNSCLLALATAIGMMAFSIVAKAQVTPPAAKPPDIAWPRDDWNPHPQPDDFILPLPCKGAIALRRVVTGPPRQAGAGNYLEDRLVTLGGTDDPIGYVGYLRSDFIAGGFYETNGQRYYLIGKYEVTVQQFDAVMRPGDCRQTAVERAALPVSDLSWFDAVEFTRRLNRWLYGQMPNALPRSADRPGFVRLPSEVEWEFAARGGLAVSDAERSNRTFVPSGGNLASHVWFAGPESAAGELKQIGSLKPNPLGLFDMLGNAEEIMLEPFRLNRAGRPHGQQGGIVLRGGSYLTPRESIRSSARTEFPVFEPNSKDEMRLPTFGMRIVISATALSQLDQAPAFQKEWEEARRTETSIAGKSAIDLLEGLLRQAVPAQRAVLQAAVEQLNDEVRKRNELQGRAVKSLLSSALAIRKNLIWTVEYLEQLNLIINVDGKQGGVQADIARRAQPRFDDQKRNFDSYASVYADLVQQLGSDFRREEVQGQAETLKTDLLTQKRLSDLPTVDAVAADTIRYREGQARETGVILRAVVGPRSWLSP